MATTTVVFLTLTPRRAAFCLALPVAWTKGQEACEHPYSNLADGTRMLVGRLHRGGSATRRRRFQLAG